MAINALSSVERVSFLQFSALLGEHAFDNDQRRLSCGWYIGARRRVAGTLFLDAAADCWRYALLESEANGWSRRDSGQFTELEHAEAALVDQITQLESGPVQIVPTPMRLRFGRGQSRRKDAT